MNEKIIPPSRLTYVPSQDRLRQPREVEIQNSDPEQTVIAGLAELSRKTALIVRRAVGPGTVERLFAEIEKYEEQERAETFSYLKHGLNETRNSLGAEAAYKDEEE